MAYRSSMGIVAAVLCLALPAGAQAGEIVLAADSENPYILHLDPWSGRQWFAGPFYDDFSGFSASGVIALATDPTTRDMYAVFETTTLDHRLVRYDPRNFRATDIGSLGEWIVGLAFDSSGTLYGITNDDVSGTPDTIFTIDTSTAAVTYFMDTPGPDAFNDTIAFNPDDGKLYHWNGYPGNFNAIDLVNKTSSSIGIPSDWPAGYGIHCFTYDSSRGLFVGKRQHEIFGSREFFTLTVSGVHAALDSGGIDARGIAFYDEPALDPVPRSPASGRFLYGVDANVNLISQVDPTTGEDLGSIGVLLDGEAVSGFNGLATDPTSGEMYAITRLDSRSQRLLVKIDPESGLATLVGGTGAAIAGIAFSADGTLYAVTGDGGNPSSTLFTVDKANATLSSFLTLSDNGSGEAIAYNSDDGRMYRFSGETEIEAIDLGSKAVSAITLSGDTTPIGTPSAAVYDERRDLFLVMRWHEDGPIYYSVTAGGIATTIDPSTRPRKGYAFSLEPSLATAASAGDRNGNGSTDIAVLLRGPGADRNFVYIMDGSTDAQLEKIAFGPEKALGYTPVPDVTGDTIPEHAVLVSGSLFARVKNPVNGDLISMPPFNAAFEPFAFLSMGDVDGDMGQDVAVLGREVSTGRVQAQVKRVSDESLVSRYNYAKDYTPIGAAVVDNVAGSPAAEIAVFGMDGVGRVRAQVKDARTGGLVNIVYFDKRFTPLAVAALPDPSGNRVYVAVLGRNSSGVMRAQIKRVSDGSLVNLVRFDGNYEPVAFLGFSDSNADGSGEVAVVGTGNTGAVRSQAKEIETGAFVSTVNFDPSFEPIKAIAINGVAGNGRSEIAVLGVNASDQHRLQVKDLRTGAPVNNIEVP